MSFGGSTPPVVRHLLLCRDVSYDLDGRTYSLHGPITALESDRYPFLVEEMWVYIQAFGDPGQYEIWFGLVPVDEDGDESGDETMFEPCALVIHEGAYIESRAWKLRTAPFPTPGLCVIRAHCGPDVLAREQLLIKLRPPAERFEMMATQPTLVLRFHLVGTLTDADRGALAAAIDNIVRTVSDEERALGGDGLTLVAERAEPAQVTLTLRHAVADGAAERAARLAALLNDPTSEPPADVRTKLRGAGSPVVLRCEVLNPAA